MTLNVNQLYSESSRGPLPRIQPAAGPGALMAKTFAGGTAETLPIGTPVYVVAATGFFAKCVPTATPGVSAQIYGIVYPAPVITAASGEVIGTVMLKGSIHYREIYALGAGGGGAVLAGTDQEIADLCRQPSNVERGIHIDGLTAIGGNDGITTGLTGIDPA